MAQASTGKLTGRVLADRYRIERELGHGDHGVCYVAMQEDENRRVVVKVLHAEHAEDPDYLRKVRQDVDAVAKLRHPKIARVIDAEQLTADPPFLVVEQLTGRSLGSEIRRGKMEVPRLVGIAQQVLSALAAAHRAGVVHGALKPENVYLLKRGGLEDIVKVLDFGIARPSQGERVFGTHAYMAPEQLARQPIDSRTDLFALGVVMFEALTGQLPYQAANADEQLEAILSQPPPQLGSIRRDLGRTLVHAIERALSRDRMIRFSRAEDMISELLSIADALPGGLSFDEETQIEPGDDAPPEPEVPAPPPRKKRHQPTLTGIGLPESVKAVIAQAESRPKRPKQPTLAGIGLPTDDRPRLGRAALPAMTPSWPRYSRCSPASRSGSPRRWTWP